MKKYPAIEYHPFKDFLPKGLRYLVIGSFPGPRRIWKMPWFYGSKYSQFWKIMERIYGSHRDISSLPMKKRLLSELHIGLTDVFRACRRVHGNASDLNLVPVRFNDLTKLLRRHSTIDTIFFTSSFVKTAFFKRIGTLPKNISCVALPSPSPRYASMSLSSKVRAYARHFPKIK